MKTANQILNLIGNLGVAVINSTDGMIHNFRLNIDSYEIDENEIRIFNLEDAEFVIPVTDDTNVNDSVITCKGYEIYIEK